MDIKQADWPKVTYELTRDIQVANSNIGRLRKEIADLRGDVARKTKLALALMLTTLALGVWFVLEVAK